jgi:hypothetical protein
MNREEIAAFWASLKKLYSPASTALGCVSAWCADSSSFQRLRIKAIQKSPLPKNFNVLGNRIANGIREKQRGEHWLVESRMTTRPRQAFRVSGAASF